MEQREQPARPWVMQPCDTYDMVMRHVSGAAWKCLDYFQRMTTGYHRDSVEVALPDIAEYTGLSDRHVKRALIELEGFHLLAKTGTGKGRGHLATFTLCPPEQWCLPTDKQDKMSPIVMPDNMSSFDGDKQDKMSPISARKQDKMSHSRARSSMSKERQRKIPEKEKDLSDVASDTDAAPVKRVRKFSGEEQAYVRRLMDAMKAERHITARLPSEGAERNAAHYFYHARDGDAADIATVVEFYRATKAQSFWQGRWLSLFKITELYAEHHGDLAAYLAAQERQHSNGNVSRPASRAEGKRSGKYDDAANPPPASSEVVGTY